MNNTITTLVIIGIAAVLTIATTTIRVQSVSALVPTCSVCGPSEFAPGVEAISPGDAQNVAPGQEAKIPGDAKDFSPGQEGLKAGIIGPELK